MTKKVTAPKGWKLCKNKNGCSKPSPDDEMLHPSEWKVKKAA
jgi:hypothetical protein